MLSIRWGTTEDTIELVDSVFDNNYEEEWFEDPLVSEMILDVDKSKVLSPPIVLKAQFWDKSRQPTYPEV